MFSKKVLVMVVVLALVSMACGITINADVPTMRVGPTQTMEIVVPESQAALTKVKLEFGAGELNIEPGAENALIEGVATYNVQDLEPTILTQGNEVTLQTGRLELRGIPSGQSKDLKNEWDLKFGDQLIDLVINAGAYQGDIELGDLSLNSLEVNDGAAEVDLEFSQPNRVRMDTLRYSTGASNIKLYGLANANFSSMIFRGGAGDYILDFGGQLEQEARVVVEAGISQVTIIVPENTPARIRFGGGLSNVDASGAWQKSGNQYELQGNGPMLIIDVTMGAGNLVLRTSP